jgi:hypothetical protein
MYKNSFKRNYIDDKEKYKIIFHPIISKNKINKLKIKKKKQSIFRKNTSFFFDRVARKRGKNTTIPHIYVHNSIKVSMTSCPPINEPIIILYILFY